jgi:Iron/manganese superoxide dismutases, alpha-hairpin domain
MTTTSGQGAAPQMTFTLPPLPYAFDALEPYIDAKTMEIHHDKHHGAYVTNLNKALEGQADLQKLSVEELLAQINKVPENIRTAVRNNGGGHMNHSMFWKIMKKGGGGEPTGDLASAIGVRQLRRLQNEAQPGCDHPFRFRLGVAAFPRRQTRDRVVRQPGQSHHGRRQSIFRSRRMGTRLLPEISKPPARIHRGMVEHDQLAASSRKLRPRQKVALTNLAPRLLSRIRPGDFLPGRVWLHYGCACASLSLSAAH